MYQPQDTIVAVSSPTNDKRTIVRLCGPRTTEILSTVFTPAITTKPNTISSGRISIDSELAIEGRVYFFPGPGSYTGQDVAELHFLSCPAMTDALLARLLDTSEHVRMAEPGEFTARAYLNGKMDLSQAEAVNAIIVSSNTYQLAASQQLLAGRLADTTTEIRSRIMDCLCLLEAGLDFTDQDIEFISRDDAAARLIEMTGELETLLTGSISYEEIAELPSVGIAGAPNAGKSTLLNRLLARERSIVSEQRKTTRDILSGLLDMAHHKCVLFDCAGLIESPDNVLDELMQQAAVEALANSSVVVFCVDISKDDHSEDAAVFKLINAGTLIAVATKADLTSDDELSSRLEQLSNLFGTQFIAASSHSSRGIELLNDRIDEQLTALAAGTGPLSVDALALTARHRQMVTEAVENLSAAAQQLKEDREEVAAMMLRAAWQGLAGIERENIDEEILGRIFERFCIGK